MSELIVEGQGVNGGHSERQHILIVDDDIESSDALRAVLEMHGYAVMVAANGAEGLRQLRAGLRPNLILLDLMMPEKNGFQFRVEQVADPELAEIPVVLFSGNPEARADGAVLGTATSLAKPVDIDQLLRVISNYCTTRRRSGNRFHPC